VDLDNLIDLIYAATAELEAWPAALSAIAEALPVRAMSLTITDPSGDRAPLVIAPRTDPQWIHIYSERWAASNVVRDRGYSLGCGAVYGFENLGIPQAEFETSEFYNEFWAPQRLNFALVMLIAKDVEAVSAVGFYRSNSDGPFDASAKRLLQKLGPHLRRSVSLSLGLGQSGLQRDGLVAILQSLRQAALLVDAKGRILFANCPAEAELGGAALKNFGSTVTDALVRLISGGAGGKLCLTSPAGATAQLEVTPLPGKTQWSKQNPAAFVLISRPQPSLLPSPEQIQTALACTRAQALLARELMHGDGIPAAAARLGVARSTARTHLLKLFQMTGTNRQAELVRLLLERLPAHS
jgi:DNA-binding CsgD family transcriptional regulator